jgi:hypothetical protein
MTVRRTIAVGDLTTPLIRDLNWAQDQLEPEYLAVVLVFAFGKVNKKWLY